MILPVRTNNGITPRHFSLFRSVKTPHRLSPNVFLSGYGIVPFVLAQNVSRLSCLALMGFICAALRYESLPMLSSAVSTLLLKKHRSTIHLYFHSLEVVSRYRDPQLQVGDNSCTLYRILSAQIGNNFVVFSTK